MSDPIVADVIFLDEGDLIELRACEPIPSAEIYYLRNMCETEPSLSSSSWISKRPVFNAETGSNQPASRFESIVVIPNCMMDPILDDQPKDARLASIREDPAIDAANFAFPESKFTDGPRYDYEDLIAMKGAQPPRRSSISTSPFKGDPIFEADGEFDVASIVHSRLPETKLNALAAIRDRSVCVKGVSACLQCLP